MEVGYGSRWVSMLSLMFWNVRTAATSFLQTACIENAIDILILAEDTSPPGQTQSLLNLGLSQSAYIEYNPVPSSIRFFTRKSLTRFSLVSDPDSRVSMRGYLSEDNIPIIIVGVHVPSKLRGEPWIDQYHYARFLRDAIEEAENRMGHSNLLIIGDMNMSPFEYGMVAVDGLHGLMDQQIAAKRARRYKSKDYRFFYNPMWSKMGDNSDGPPGTYFYNSSGVLNFYWNTFDQVLIRPELLPYYSRKAVQIVTKIGITHLLKNGRIDTSISDHLPLVLNLQLKG